ncbi:MFS transporter [Gordonibacter sp. 28C]|uniref:MFS transporter n=1 Tax=Gordonibacter sp. 28C TaxID=2078569 RepID=UPI000DF748BA|nr:MFS transporter [Gordonibacter sp. 28C]RDB64435.1 MFS transporter [Gordonibacter sp. 28C]
MAGKGKFHYGFLIVASCIACCFGPCALTFSCAGIFYAPVSEYLGVGKGVFAIYMTILCLSMTVSLPFMGKLIDKRDARVVLSVAACLVGAGLIAMSFYDQVWQFYISGALMGCGDSALLYLATPTLINRWFKKRNGFFIGLSMAFTGVGGIVFNMVGGSLIASGPEGWRMGYLVFGIIALVLALPFTAFVIRSYPADKGLLPYGYEESQTNSGEATQLAAPTGVSASVAMRSPVFYAIAIVAGFIGFDTVIYQFIPSYAVSLEGIAPTVAAMAATLASAAMLGQTLGKIALGGINDKGVLLGLSVGVISGIIGLVLMWLVPSQVVVMMIGAFVFGIYYASATVQMPILTASVFGQREYSSIYSRISMVSSLGAAFAATIWGFIIDATGFSLVFIIGIALAILVWLLGAYAIKAGKKFEWTE